MNELSKIEPRAFGDNIFQTINARDLHAFLGVGKDFSTWIKGRIEQYNFVENQDFVLSSNLRSPERGSAKARPQWVIDYHITLDMAKELSMVERTDKGKEARTYFIQCERIAKAAVPDPRKALRDPSVLRELLLESTERVIELYGFVDGHDYVAAPQNGGTGHGGPVKDESQRTASSFT